MKKFFIFSAILLMASSIAFGQAKKPTLMVLPSDVWCNQNGYTKTFDNQGEQETIPDYKKAVSNDMDLVAVIAKINSLMADRGFPLKDVAQITKSISAQTAEDNLRQSRSGSTILESPIDRLRRTAKADIILDLTWKVNSVGPKKSITYTLKGMDAYSNKQIAGATGTGKNSFSAELPILLEEAVQDHMEAFCGQLMNHFEDMVQNGREIAVDIKVWDNGSGLDLEKEFDGTELSEIIDNWISDNTVQHRFGKGDATENFISYEDVRIPLYKANGQAQDAEGFGRELRKFLADAPYNIPSKLVRNGLGKCTLYLGEK